LSITTDVSTELNFFGTTGSARKTFAGSRLDELQKFSRIISTAEFSVGFTNDKHPDSDLSYAQLATILEFGSPSRGIVARPYLERSSRIVVPSIRRNLIPVMERLGSLRVKVTKAQILNELSAVSNDAAEKTKSVIRRRSVRVSENREPYRSRKRAGGFGERPWIKTGNLVANIQGFVRLK